MIPSPGSSGEVAATARIWGNMQYFTNPKQLNPTKIISLDTEYSEQDIKKASLLSISVGLSPDNAGIFEPKDLGLISSQLQAAEVIFTQNGAVDWHMLKRHGLSLNRSKFVDCMLMEHLIDENLGHSLGEMAIRYFSDSYKSEFWNTYSSYQEAPREDALEYELRDAIYTYRLGCKFYEGIQNKKLIEHVHRLYWALFDTEITGVKINLDLMKSTQVTMSEQINSYLPKLRENFNGYCNIWELEQWSKELDKRTTDKGKSGVRRPTFSFSSDAQVRWLVYDSLGVPVTEKTKKGSPKTDFDTLDKASQAFPELRPLVEYKGVKGIYATFVEGLLDKVVDSRIYPRFLVNGTTTGRISHASPNLGNLPREGVIRNFFMPDNDRVLIGADYSQLEVIVEANLTEDKSLLKIINEGASKHDITADGLGITRDQAKTLNFALQYGAGIHKVSKLLGVSYKEAEGVFSRYWEIYSGVKKLKDETCQQLSDTGRVTNLFGRTRNFSKPANEFEKARQERQAYNFLVQGVGADITNRAFYLYAEHLNNTNNGRALWSVHDEILAEVNIGLEEEEKECLIKMMISISSECQFKYSLEAKSYGPMICWGKT